MSPRTDQVETVVKIEKKWGDIKGLEGFYENLIAYYMFPQTDWFEGILL